MKHTFSAMWTEQLGKAIRRLAPTIYPMDLAFNERNACISAVNQGIDSHFEACNVPDRGDSYKDRDARFSGPRLVCKVSNESLPVLVRRLLESGDETSLLLASSICETLGIELI